MPAYPKIIVEKFFGLPRGDKGEIRVRPAKGQPYPPSLVVECSKSFRGQHPVGTKLLVSVKLCTNREGTEFL
jgi:hypothetical protein